MKNMKKMLAALIAGMLFVLIAPVVHAEEVQPEPQAEEQVVREEKAEEPKAEETAEEPKAEETTAPEVTTTEAEVTEPETAPEVSAQPEAAQEQEVTETPVERSIVVVASESNLKVGDTLKLTAKLAGFDGVEYTLNWQVKAQHGEWKNISGEQGETLKVELTAETIGSAWRVTVETAD
jgi:cytoskeletal protein RodZ